VLDRGVGNRSQSAEAARSRFQYAQDFLLHGNLSDQLRLIHAAVLAQDIMVECRANRGLHLQDPCVKLIASDAGRAIRHGRGMAVVRSPDARPMRFAEVTA
jgi:hypothetical protein